MARAGAALVRRNYRVPADTVQFLQQDPIRLQLPSPSSDLRVWVLLACLLEAGKQCTVLYKPSLPPDPFICLFVCSFARPSARPSVRPSARLPVRPSVRSSARSFGFVGVPEWRGRMCITLIWRSAGGIANMENRSEEYLDGRTDGRTNV